MPVPVRTELGGTGRHLVPGLDVECDRHHEVAPLYVSVPHVEIAAIAGSLRAASWARLLLRAAATQLPPHVGLTIWDGLEGVPPFNEDAESGPEPSAVADMRQLIDKSDAF